MSDETIKESKKRLAYARRCYLDRMTPEDKTEMWRIVEDYRRFLTEAKTERESASILRETALRLGFFELTPESKPEGRLFVIPYRNKVIALARLGTGPIVDGLRIVAAHHDSPRIDLKGNPLYEEQGVALLKTHYFGSIRKHQWVTRPLALHGVVILGNGESREINIGEKEDDPVFTIMDLLPHLAHEKQDVKKLSEAIPGEKLNLVVGGIPVGEETDSERVRIGILRLLNETFGMTEEDFVSAELEIVPSGGARYVGFDRAFIGGYGQDDRVCSYTAARALIDAAPTRATQLIICFDKEEIGSFGNTSAQGHFLHFVVEELLRAAGQEARATETMRALHRSKAISADVGTGLDPDWQEVHDKRNAARVGCGIVLKKYTGSRGKTAASDASAEYIGEVRRMLNKAGVAWQTAEMGKVDEGGGGTIAKFIAMSGAEVLDAGPPVLAMHSPFEIMHVADVFSAYKAFRTFLENDAE
jgi:aspartyl aminopeptidase